MKNGTKFCVGATLYKPNILRFALLLVWAVMQVGMVGCKQSPSASGGEVATDPIDKKTQETATDSAASQTQEVAAIDRDLLDGIREGRVELVQQSLNHGANVNVVLNKGGTALMLAIIEGHIEVVRVLLAQPNLKLNAHDRDGWPPLFFALKSERSEVLELLLRQPGLDVNAKDLLGLTALNWAIIKEDAVSVQLLLQQPEIDFEVRDALGRTPLMWAAMLCRTQLTDVLLGMKTESQRIDVNAVDASGRSALMWAAFKGCSTVVERLLEQPGISLDDEDHRGMTALNFAIEGGHAEVIPILNSRRLL